MLTPVVDPSLPIIFQEPDFTRGDRTFLESRGLAVVDDPLAFEAIAEDPGGCVVVGFHLYVPVYEKALGDGKGGLPRVFIGTGWDVWDKYVPPFSLSPPFALVLFFPPNRSAITSRLLSSPSSFPVTSRWS